MIPLASRYPKGYYQQRCQRLVFYLHQRCICIYLLLQISIGQILVAVLWLLAREYDQVEYRIYYSLQCYHVCVMIALT